MAKSKFTPELLKKARKLSTLLYTNKQIYEALNISYDTFYTYMREFPDFFDAITEGRKKTRDTLLEASLEKAKTDTYMQTFFLKNKFGYMEQQQRKNLKIKQEELKLKQEQFKLQKERFIAEITEKANLSPEQLLELLKKHGIS